jgi:hypothetical protein
MLYGGFEMLVDVRSPVLLKVALLSLFDVGGCAGRLPTASRSLPPHYALLTPTPLRMC